MNTGVHVFFFFKFYLIILCWFLLAYAGFPGGSDSKVSVCSAGDPSSIPGLGRAPGEGNGSPLQYSCLENALDGGAWQATVHGVAKSRTRLSDFTFTFTFTFRSYAQQWNYWVIWQLYSYFLKESPYGSPQWQFTFLKNFIVLKTLTMRCILLTIF